MIRPCRRRIMPFRLARASRNAAVRLTEMTMSHSASFMRMKRLSRVTPALFTNTSSRPIAASAAGTSASTASELARSQGSTCAPSPSSAASASSASRRVPDNATWAPWLCSARAIAPPRPPEAPVTSAVFPLRSNIDSPFVARSPGGGVLVGRDVFGGAHAERRSAGRDALDEAGEHLAGADLDKAPYPLPCHKGDALAPAHRSGDLRDQTLANRRGIAERARAEIGDERRPGRLQRRLLQRFGHRLGRRPHQCAVEGRGDGQQQGALGALQL